MSRRTLALAALSGLILASSFPPVALDFLAWFALVPLLCACGGLRTRDAFLAGMVAGIVFFCGTLYWISYALNAHSPFSAMPAALLTVLFCTVLALFIGLFGAAVALLRKHRPGLFLIAAPAVWVALELARTHLLSGFPWALLGYSQYRVLPVIQIADSTGVYGISFLIVLANAAVASFLEDRKRFLPLLTAVAVIGAAAGYGMLRLGQSDGNEGLRVSVVQGNIEQDRKWDPAHQAAVMAAYKRLTVKALKSRPDLVIWPETALPFYFGSPEPPYPALTADLKGFARSAGTSMLVGSALRDIRDRKHILRNAAVFLNEEGGIDDYYTKHRLVPFGEYVPLKDSLLFFVNKLVQPAGDFKEGREYTVVGVRSAALDRNVPISTVICYEIIFPGHVRRFVNDGAAIITTITNDAWFGKSSAPYQHFSMAVLRAVENRVPVARAANTGISGFIDAHGRMLDASDIFTEAVLTRSLVPGNSRTFYTRYGDVFAWLCVFGTILAILPLPRRIKRPASPTEGQ